MGIKKLKALSKKELGSFLLEKQLLFETREFIPDDPISIPHLFTNKADIEKGWKDFNTQIVAELVYFQTFLQI